MPQKPKLYIVDALDTSDHAHNKRLHILNDHQQQLETESLGKTGHPGW